MNETQSRNMCILVSGAINEHQNKQLRSVAPDASFSFVDSDAELHEQVGEADIVAGTVGPDALKKSRQLKWVHSWAAGPDAQLFPEFVESGIQLTSSKGNGAVPLAEHALMLMLMLNRNAMRWIDGHRNAAWDRFTHSELNGKTVGIIGTGNSGMDLALKCKAFHMRTLGLRREVRPTDNFDTMYTRENLHEFLAESDFVVVTAPKTEHTVNMLDAEAFRAMKPTAYYVCISRGGIANDDALLAAVRNDWIAGAGLDAHDIEPLPGDSPFWTLKNTIITPHNAATTEETKNRGFEIFRENLARYVKGNPLINLVDPKHGY